MTQLVSFLVSMVPGTFFSGASDVVVKRILREKIPEGLLLGVNLGIAGLILFSISTIVGYPEIKSAFWPAFLATVILNIFGQLAWYKAFKREDVSLITPLRLLIPPLVLLTSFFILKEKPSFFGVVGVMVVVSGLWFLLSSQANFSQRTFLQTLKNPGVLWGLAGVTFFSVSFPFDKQAVVNSSAAFFSGAANIIIGVISFFIALAANRTKNKEAIRNLWQAKKLIAVNIVFYALAAFLVSYALNFALAAYAAATKRLQVFWTILISGRILKEENIGKKLLAAAVMFSGVAIIIFLG